MINMVNIIRRRQQGHDNLCSYSIKPPLLPSNCAIYLKSASYSEKIDFLK